MESVVHLGLENNKLTVFLVTYCYLLCECNKFVVFLQDSDEDGDLELLVDGK